MPFVGFHGSPTVLIGGIDPFADVSTVVGLACRFYRTPDGPAEVPTIEQLRIPGVGPGESEVSPGNSHR